MKLKLLPWFKQLSMSIEKVHMSLYPFSLLLGAIAFLPALLLTSCDGPNATTPDDLTTATDATSVATDATPETPTSSTNPSLTTPSGLISSSPAVDYSLRLLDATELEMIEFDLEPDRNVIADQSFLLDIPNLGEAALVASESNREGVRQLHLDWKSPVSEGDYFSLPLDQAISSWIFWEIKEISFGDFNSDSLGPDVIVIAEYMTGIGPTGAQPFAVTTVFFHEAFNENTYSYFTITALNQMLQEKEIETIGEAKSEIEAFLGR